MDLNGFETDRWVWGEGYTFKENYVKKLVGYAWIRFNRVVELGRTQKKSEIDAEIEFESIEGNSSSWDADGAVKVLSEKTGYDDNF